LETPRPRWHAEASIERLLGLSTVVIQNAMGQPEQIPGLKASSAESLRDEILRRLPH
jgi:membrane protein YdbS with pleckstrin-like domain